MVFLYICLPGKGRNEVGKANREVMMTMMTSPEAAREGREEPRAERRPQRTVFQPNRRDVLCPRQPFQTHQMTQTMSASKLPVDRIVKVERANVVGSCQIQIPQGLAPGQDLAQGSPHDQGLARGLAQGHVQGHAQGHVQDHVQDQSLAPVPGVAADPGEVAQDPDPGHAVALALAVDLRVGQGLAPGRQQNHGQGQDQDQGQSQGHVLDLDLAHLAQGLALVHQLDQGQGLPDPGQGRGPLLNPGQRLAGGVTVSKLVLGFWLFSILASSIYY